MVGRLQRCEFTGDFSISLQTSDRVISRQPRSSTTPGCHRGGQRGVLGLRKFGHKRQKISNSLTPKIVNGPTKMPQGLSDSRVQLSVNKRVKRGCQTSPRKPSLKGCQYSSLNADSLRREWNLLGTAIIGTEMGCKSPIP